MTIDIYHSIINDDRYGRVGSILRAGPEQRRDGSGLRPESGCHGRSCRRSCAFDLRLGV